MQHFLHALFEGSRAALQSIRAHALRSSLTTLGIIIGVASVITVVGHERFKFQYPRTAG